MRVRIGGVTKSFPSPLQPLLVPSGVTSTPPWPHPILFRNHLRWMLQKDALRQDMFLFGPPGPTRRRLVQWYCEITGREMEWLTLSRDTSEGDLQQRREMRDGTLTFVDQAPVRAAKFGRLLVIDGVDKAERNVLPILNNLLENREMNLPDGTHLRVTNPGFCVVALGIPVPRYPGYPMDPPFRSRFQCRLVADATSVEQVAELARVASLPEADVVLLSACWEYLSQCSAIPGAYDGMVPNIIARAPSVGFRQAFFDAYPAWGMPLSTTQEETTTLGKVVSCEPPPIPHQVISFRDIICSSKEDMCVVGMSGTGKSTLVRDAFSSSHHRVVTIQCYKDMTTRELLLRREIDEVGNTKWVWSPLIRTAIEGGIVVLDGVQRLDSAVLCSLQSLVWDRDVWLPDGSRLLSCQRYDVLLKTHTKSALTDARIHCIHSTFRVFALGLPPTNETPWLTSEVMSMFRMVVLPAAGPALFKSILARADVTDQELAERLLSITEGMNLTPRQLRRVARRAKHSPSELREAVTRAVMLSLMPSSLRDQVTTTLDKLCPAEKAKIPADVTSIDIVIPSSYKAPAATGVGLIPNITFFSIPYQIQILNSVIKDFVHGERYFLFIGNQGTGKNKLCDFLLQTLHQEREYMQLHRDVTVQSLTVTCVSEDGNIRWEDSPLVSAVRHGRMLVVDEADKAPLEVVCILKTLVEDGELLMHNGEVLRVTSPNFGVIVLANRPGFPFLGNDFFKECGDVFTSYVIDNPDPHSEVALLKRYAPGVPDEILMTVCRAFAEMRTLVDKGTLAYPFSTRELVNVIRHFAMFPKDGLVEALRNVLNFESYHKDVVDQLVDILKNHGIPFQAVATVKTTSSKVVASRPCQWPMPNGTWQPWADAQWSAMSFRNVTYELGPPLRENPVEMTIPNSDDFTETIMDFDLKLTPTTTAIMMLQHGDSFIVATSATNTLHVVSPLPTSTQWIDRLMDFSFIVGKLHTVEKLCEGWLLVCGFDDGYLYTVNRTFSQLIHFEIPKHLYPAKAQRTSRRYSNYDEKKMFTRVCCGSVAVMNKDGKIGIWRLRPEQAEKVAFFAVDPLCDAFFVDPCTLCVLQKDGLTYYLRVDCGTHTALCTPKQFTPMCRDVHSVYVADDFVHLSVPNAVLRIHTKDGGGTMIDNLEATTGVVVGAGEGVILRAVAAGGLDVVMLTEAGARLRSLPAHAVPGCVSAAPFSSADFVWDWGVVDSAGRGQFLLLNEAALKNRSAIYTAMVGDTDGDEGGSDNTEGTGDGAGQGSGTGTGSGGSGGGQSSGTGGGQGGDLESSGLGGYAISHEGKVIAQAAIARVKAARGSSVASTLAATPAQYVRLLDAVTPMLGTLRSVWNAASAKEKERVWNRGQSQGELDDTRIVDALLGDPNVFRRRGKAQPVLGLPQRRPKYLHLLVDVSASMARFNSWDKRLDLCAQAAVLVMETLHPLDTKFKLAMSGHSGSSSHIPLVTFSDSISNPKVRSAAIEKMYGSAFSAQTGDGTLEAIALAVRALRAIPNADDRIVVAFSDANLGGYNVTPPSLRAVMESEPGVSVYVIFVAEPRASQYLQAELPPSRAYFLTDTALIPSVVRELLQHTVQE